MEEEAMLSWINKKHPLRYRHRYGLVLCLACSYALVYASNHYNIVVISERGYTLRSCVCVMITHSRKNLICGQAARGQNGGGFPRRTCPLLTHRMLMSA